MPNPDTDFIALIEDIRTNRSLTSIHLDVDNYMQRTTLLQSTHKQRALVRFIAASNDLDEIRLACAIYLGLTEEAQTLQEWLAAKPQLRAQREAMFEELHRQLDTER